MHALFNFDQIHPARLLIFLDFFRIFVKYSRNAAAYPRERARYEGHYHKVSFYFEGKSLSL